MYFEIEFSSVLNFAIICCALFLSVLFLFINKKNKSANIYLSLFLCSLAVESLSLLFESVRPHIEFTFSSSLFTITFLLFYVLKTLNLKIKLYHYSIYLFSIILTILAFEIEIIEQIEYIYNISLLIVINYILGKYQKELKNYYTNLQSKSLDWIQIISFIFLGFNAFWIIEDILSLFVNYEFQMFPLLSMLGTMFVVFWVAKSGLKQSDIFSQEFHDYTKSGIKTSLDNEKLLWNSVEKKIKKDEIFLNPKLNLKQLSDSLNINEKELSKLINKHSQTNFFNYINKFRVEYFKESINQNKIDNLSILGIAMESGFNSKSTFYTAFKNIENCSPSQFLKKNNKSE